MKPEDLKAGAFYQFNHVAMGEFFARFDRVETRDNGDEFVHVSILTATGSTQERHANAVIYLSTDGIRAQKRPVVWQDRGLRPSKLRSINAPSTRDQSAWQEKAANAEKDYAVLREKYLNGSISGPISGPSLMELRPSYQKLADVPGDLSVSAFDKRLLAIIPVLGAIALGIAKLVGLF